MLRKLFIIGIVNLFVFLAIYKLLQHNGVYRYTLGAVSQNYQSFGDSGNPDIRRVSNPYVSITDDKFDNWDASIYRCIKDNMYADTGCYAKVKGAFFPLFPMVWKILHVNNIEISLFNYLIFIFSVALLIINLYKSSDKNKLLVYAMLISLPSVIVYFIPYTEALFLLCMTLSVIGLIKKKYYLYFIGTILLAMVRPATVFVFLAFLMVEIISLAVNKDLKAFMKNCLQKLSPFLLGYFLVVFIQYLSSSSWTLISNAGTHWSGGVIQKITGISDWPSEGFGLTAFALFFVCLPVTIYLGYIIRSKQALRAALQQTESYILMVSMFYMVGIMVYIFLTSGGNLHSFSRFILDSPPFYITVILLLNGSGCVKKNMALILCTLPLALLIIFLSVADYGGSRMDFSYMGLYFYVFIFLFMFLRERLPFNVQLEVVVIFILVSLLWNTYLLNMFFNEAWMFT
jgi:hypothetical protein